MQLDMNIETLLEYTDWERQEWRAVLERQGDPVLKISAGPHGDGRFECIGELIRHIFSAEKRYVERLLGQPLTDTASIPFDSVGRLFEFGQQSRTALRQFIRTLPAPAWDAVQEFTLMKSTLTATPRKVIIHVVMHEIRHWAQVATLLRLQGVTGPFHDFLFSPVLGGGLAAGGSSA